MKIGICGGTFDPFHRGHLDPVLSARGDMSWDRIVYIPAFMQPFKTDRATASSHHRFAMTVLGTGEHDALYVDPRELERGAISYTVDTLRELRAEHPQDTLDWIIGDDNLAELHKWKAIETIAGLANFTVLVRAGTSSPKSDLPGGLKTSTAHDRPRSGAVVYARNEMVPVSSTEIRRRVRGGEPIEDLVPPPVARYIHHYDLYRKGQS